MQPSWPSKKPFVRGIPVGAESRRSRIATVQTDGETNYRHSAIEESVVVGTDKNATDVNNAAVLSRSILTPKGWSWQEKHGFVQGRVLSPDSRTIYIAGQASVDDKGNPINKGNIEAQFVQALTNLAAVVAEAGGTLANVVKVTYFTTDIDRFFQGEKVLVKHLLDHNCYPTSTLVGVKSLFHPDILFEVEAIAVV